MRLQLHERELKGIRRSLRLYSGYDFCSNDYLSLASRPLKADASVNGGSTGSRLISGNSSLIEQFEPVSYTHLTLPTILLV